MQPPRAAAGLPSRVLDPHATTILRRAARRLAGKSPPGRHVKVFSDDVFLVSYPRSGNTWLRSILCRLIRPDLDPFSNLDTCVPDIYAVGRRELHRSPRPRLLKSHEPFDSRYRDVIYLVRDPRDVLVSYYRFHLLRGRLPVGYPLVEFANRFLSGDLDRFGRWSDHVRGWVDVRRRPSRFLLVRYEDALRSPAQVVERIAAHIAIELAPSDALAVVNSCSIERMRTAERSGRMLADRRRVEGFTFIGQGASGSGKATLPSEVVQRIEEKFGAELRLLGY